MLLIWIRSIGCKDFLRSYDGTAIVISHDRHFLNSVCTHIVAAAMRW